MSSSPSSSSSPPQTSGDSPPSNLPLKKIPGEYGLPFLGPIRDRYNYFYNQGKDKFFQSRIQKYNSTIFRTNMPPGPFIARNPNVIAVLDAVSFPVLFDTTKVEKKNVFEGTFFPSTAFTGGYRVCAYLDPSEPNHAATPSSKAGSSLSSPPDTTNSSRFSKTLSHISSQMLKPSYRKTAKQISTR